MESAQRRYEEMLLEPAVPTAIFHQVLEALLEEGAGEEILDRMNSLLHIPHVGPVDWEQEGFRLAAAGTISTVTEEEAMGAYLPNESPQEWDVLSRRVVEARKASL